MLRIFLSIAFALWAPVALAATEFTSPQATARFVTDVSTVAPGQTFWAGVQLKLAPGWHSYWQNPGDSGVAGEIIWQLPAGVTAGPIHWPAPSRQAYGDLTDFGYADEFYMLSPLTVAAGAKGPVTLAVEANWLVCKDICIPQSTKFSIELSMAATASPSADAANIQVARGKIPPLTDLNAKFSVSGAEVALTVEIPKSAGCAVEKAEFYPAEGGVLKNPPENQFVVQDCRVTFTLPRAEGAAEPKHLDGIISIYHGNHRQDYWVEPVQSNAPTAPAMGLGWALLLAMLGGVILNIMPCVLPILSLKALALTKKAHGDRRVAGRLGLAYTGGVLVCFATLGGVLMVLQMLGNAVGWGYHLQSAGFVLVLAYVMFLAGLNLSGMFSLPVLLGGAHVAHKHAHAESFFTGLLAALVATPCTAPFMAPALGFALTQAPIAAMAVFLALGFGMALPFLLLSFCPHLLAFLPKPGPWMNIFKHALAFPMYATAAWLVWVLVQQTGADGVLVALLGAVLLTFGIWLRAHAPRAALWVMAGSIFLSLWFVQAPPPLAKNAGVFDPTRVKSLHAEGKPVFVTVTAAWCLTCKVNEKLALSTPEFQAWLHDKNVTYLVADWTRRDAVITEYLKSFDRQGVPLYVYYPPHGEPRMLPQILTPAIVAAETK